MTITFPAVRWAQTNTITSQVGHVVSEAAEVLQANNAGHRLEEIVDLLHSADTLRRIAIREYGEEAVAADVFGIITKNAKRGYYLPETDIPSFSGNGCGQ
jgi:hypothetical protein